MKLGQLIEYNKGNIFFKIYAENEEGRLVLDLFYLLKKLDMRQKHVVCSLISVHFDSP